MRMARTVTTTALLVALAGAALPAAADAKVRNLWPTAFKPTHPGSSYYLGSQHLASFADAPVEYEALVKLPAGARITKVVCHADIGGEGIGVSATLYRRRFTEARQAVAYGDYLVSTGGQAVPVDLPISGDPVVRRGYQYSLLVTVMNWGSNVRGCSVSYR